MGIERLEKKKKGKTLKSEFCVIAVAANFQFHFPSKIKHFVPEISSKLNHTALREDILLNKVSASECFTFFKRGTQNEEDNQ